MGGKIFIIELIDSQASLRILRRQYKHESTMRRLIICFDGTWNKPEQGGKPTNVVKMVRAIKNMSADGVSQLTFYDKGVGTGGVCDRFLGGAFGVGLMANVIDGYRFLGNNYVPGDEIYVFGFSRGAYTARSLVGLINLAGIFQPQSLGKDLRDLLNISNTKGISSAEKREMISRLGADSIADARVKCVGVWDTVGSLGIPGDIGKTLTRRAYRFHDVELSPIVDVALHAVAIDEKRLEFAPALWDRKKGDEQSGEQVVEQVWFPGVHSNVGGSYPDEGLSDLTLDWMVKRLKKHTNLFVDKDYLSANCKPEVEGRGRESRSLLYTASRIHAYQRLINQTVPNRKGPGGWLRKKLRFMDGRNLIEKGRETVNEAVHISALDRWNFPGVLHDTSKKSMKKRAYRPINLEAAIKDKSVRIVGYDGEHVSEADFEWPHQ